MADPASSYQEALDRRLLGTTEAWTGDGWKTIVHLRSCAGHLGVGVLDCDYGFGVLVRHEVVKRLPFAPQTIRAWTYRDLEAQRRELLDLQPPQQLFKMLGPDCRARNLAS